MCGLVGVVGEVDEKALCALTYLGNLAGLRGEHSTGLMGSAFNKKKTPYHTFKTLEPASRVFSSDGLFDREFYYGRYKHHKPDFVAVHARYATVGNVTKENAHPFTHGNIIGMHNGTVKASFENKDKFETDSEAIIHNISLDEDKTLKDLESTFFAAYVLVWVNMKKNTLNFYRNNDRPLWFYTTNDKKTSFWASDKHWLMGVAPYWGFRGILEELSVDKRVTINLSSKNPLEKPTITDFSRPKFDTVQSYYGAAEEKKDTRQWCALTSSWATQEEVDKAKAEAEKKRSSHLSLVGEKPKEATVYCKTFGEIWVTEDKYRLLLNEGCCGCKHLSTLGEQVRFIDKDNYVCSTCKLDNELVTIVEEDLKITKQRSVG